MRFEQFARAALATTPAVVLGVFDATGLGVIRDLAQAGIPVLALDTNPRAIGFTSRYPARGVCPDPHYDEAAFIQCLLDIGRKLPQRAVLLPCQDDCVFACARHAGALEERFLLPFSSWPIMQTLASKEAQVEAARKAQVGVPQTAFIHDESDLEAAAQAVPFPALLKSSEHLALRRRHFGKVVRVTRKEELPEQYRRIAGTGPLLLQEVVPGGHDALLTLLCYLDRDSRPLAMFTRRKLREHPRGGFGVARFGESVWMQDVADSGLRLLQEIGYHGVAGVEFKRDPRDGRLKLMEVNARHEMWHGFASALGISVSVAAYLDAVGRPLVAPRQIDGPRYIWATRDLPESVQDVLQGRMSVLQWLASLRGVKFDLMLSLRDPVPGVYQPAVFGLRALRRRLPFVSSKRTRTPTREPL